MMMRVLFALLIASVTSYFFSSAEKFWLPLSTIWVMQTTIGVALRQGLQRYFFLVFVVALVSYLLNSGLIYARLQDVTIGAVIGILINAVIQRKPDAAFREAVIPILNSYANYFVAISDFLFQKMNAEKSKHQLQKTVLKKFPKWIYQPGYSPELKKGQEYFLLMMNKTEQVLFSLHHLARHEFDPAFLDDLQPIFFAYFDGVKRIFFALNTVLSLQKIAVPLSDLSEELELIEKKFAPPTLELLELSKDHIYFSALLEDLKDLRAVLIALTQALR